MIFQPNYYPEAMSSQDKITISGVVFHVEDTCRNLLNDYLKSVQQERQKLREERVAELLLEELKEVGKQIVTEEQVLHLIQKTKHLQMPD